MKVAKHLIGSAVLVLSLHSLEVQAALETWQLSATIENNSWGYVPDNFPTVGQTVSLTYVIDTAPADTGRIDSFDVVSSVSFDGQVSLGGPGVDILNWAGLHAMNTRVFFPGQEITAVSLNSLQTDVAQDVPGVLAGFAAAINQGVNPVSLRFDFGDLGKIYAKPTSFTLAVPEPSAYAMLLVGMGALGFAVRRKKSAA